MKNIIELVKLQLDSRFDFLSRHNLRKSLFSFLTAIAVFFAIFIVSNSLLGQIRAYLQIIVNQELCSIVITAFFLILLIFAIGSVINNMYLSKDNELFLVLPVTFNELFISKIILLYVSELMFSLKYLLPIFMSIAYIGNLGFSIYFLQIIFMPIFVILPLALASILSIPIMYVVKFFKKHSLLSTITILLFVVFAFILYMALINKVSGAFNIMQHQTESSMKINKEIIHLGRQLGIFKYLGKGIYKSQYFYYDFIYLFISGAALFICFLLVKPFFYRIATISIDGLEKDKERYSEYKIRKPLISLIINEARDILRSLGAIFQYFLFPILMPLIVLAYDKLLINITVNQSGKMMIYASHVLVLTLISLMSNIYSGSCLSKDGATFYISKITPVKYQTSIQSKVIFNMIITISSIIVTTIISLIFVRINPIALIITSIAISITSVAHICEATEIDLRNPLLKWYDNSEITTVSKSTTKTIILALLLSCVNFAIAIFGSSSGIIAVSILLLILSIIYMLLRIHMLKIRVLVEYEKIEV